jgi:DNA-directed RNA polymerase subunit H
MLKHKFIPEHVKLKEKEKKEVMEHYGASVQQFPKILKSDPAIAHLEAKPGDIILIKRQSVTAKESDFYRIVI